MATVNEKIVFLLHLLYSIVEGVIAGMAVLNAYILVKNFHAYNYQVSILVQFSFVLLIFSIFLNEMVAVGERSGMLVEMLERMAVHYEEELDYKLNKVLTVLEPILIVLVGVIVVVVLLAIYSPIFALWSGLGG